MFRSLRGRLIILLVLLVAAAIAAGMLMVGLFRQSATAQAGQAEAQIGRACDAIAGAYRFYSAGWQGPPPGPDREALRRDLTTVIQTALHDRSGIEGGIWQHGTGALAHAFPTYQGSGPKTDVPVAQLPGIERVNRAAVAELGQPRKPADLQSRQVATGERLAAIGRVSAGVAHEIRNPIAAMRLKAENAIAGDPERKSKALVMILEQIERLDALLQRLL